MTRQAIDAFGYCIVATESVYYDMTAATQAAARDSSAKERNWGYARAL